MKLRLLGGCWLILISVALGQEPTWWSERDVLIPGKPASDYRVANQGQVKHMAVKAYEEFDAKWPDPANTNILSLISAFPMGGNYRPANLGMLKHTAQPFYDRLIAAGYAADYPWSGGTPSDYAAANLGQLKNLFSFDLDAFDADADGLPDWWEKLYFGAITGAVASADTDADGLTNLEEYMYRTNPLKEDTSGDGIPDGWAVQYGFDPLDWIADQDANGDGLTNGENYLHGADPWAIDTNGDGVSDFLAIRIFRIDPLVSYFTGGVTPHTVVSGSAGTAVAGTWSSTPEGYLRATVRNGVVEYTLPVTTSGTYVLVFEVEQYNALTAQDRFDLSLEINGHAAGRQTVTAPKGTSAAVVFVTPWLESGDHQFTLHWHNLRANTFLAIRQVGLVEMGGYDTDESGVADWIEYRQANALTHSEIESSPISPVCFEGYSGYRDSLLVDSTAAEPEEIITIRKGPRELWYANVPLDSDGLPTDIILRDEFVAMISTQVVTWTETNLLPEREDPLQIRKGDALRLSAHPDGETNGTVEINIVGVTNYLTTAEMPVPHVFAEAGEFTVDVLWSHDGTSSNSTTMVEVIHAAFPGNPACVIGRVREWACPQLPIDNVDLVRDIQTYVEQAPAAEGGSLLTLGILTDQARYIVARLGEEGLILDSAEIIGFNADNGSYWTIVGTYPDGSRIVEVQLSLGNVPPDLVVELEIFAGGVLFENGTKNLTLTEADFDERGVAVYRFIQAPESMTSVCHTTRFYESDAYIGGN